MSRWFFDKVEELFKFLKIGGGIIGIILIILFIVFLFFPDFVYE
jgi:hypothetical protein